MVEEKEKAEKTFEKALSTGRGAGLVSQDAKDARRACTVRKSTLTHDRLWTTSGLRSIPTSPFPSLRLAYQNFLSQTQLTLPKRPRTVLSRLKRILKVMQRRPKLFLPQLQSSSGQPLRRGCPAGSRSTTTWTGRTRTARCRSSTDTLFTSLCRRTWKRCQ